MKLDLMDKSDQLQMFFICFQNELGNLQITSNGLRMDGVAEFTKRLRVKTISGQKVRILPDV